MFTNPVQEACGIHTFFLDRQVTTVTMAPEITLSHFSFDEGGDIVSITHTQRSGWQGALVSRGIWRRRLPSFTRLTISPHLAEPGLAADSPAGAMSRDGKVSTWRARQPQSRTCSGFPAPHGHC